MTRRRLDTELVRRGLVASRSEARRAVDDGLVLVAGTPASKPSTMVADDVPVRIAREPRPFVSRGGEKLDAALRRFDLDVTGARCLDAGASTGGFTDRLLQAGASHVVAVDVGYGQLAWRLREDPRVTVLERTNVRTLTPDRLPYLADVLVADLSFISLRVVLPALATLVAPDAVGVLLVKPQFEAGPDDVGSGGVVREPDVWARVLAGVIGAATRAGFGAEALMASPRRGPAGNVEFLLLVGRGAPAEAIDIGAAIEEGREVAS